MPNISLDNYLAALTLLVEGIELKGFLSKKGIANFLNVPYATVPSRFRTAEPIALSDLSPKGVNVYQYGPRCPQKVETTHLLMSNMFERLSSEQQTADETACLNLNIYSPPPPRAATTGSKLPVFVWIHGGAFNIGDNTVQFDGNHLVQRSLELGQPIVLVAINYRLNVLGFLSSHELTQEAISEGETPVVNQGLNDQRIALQWVQSSIHHFGGDASRVTLCGESAGAASVLSHIQGGLPLFQQALLQSPPVLRLRTAKEAQVAFDKLVASAGVSSDASGAEKLTALRALTSQQLMDHFDGSLSFPTEDPLWYAGGDCKQKDLSSFWGRLPSWCRRAVFGNTQHESALMLADVENLTTRQTIDFTRLLVSDVSIPFSMFKTVPSKRELISWSTREIFINPLLKVVSVAAEQGTQVYLYRISCEDPFPGPLQGYTWHSFGVPLTFYQPPCRVYSGLAAIEDDMSAAFLNFLYGREPWESFNEGRRMICWNGKSTQMVSDDVAMVEPREEDVDESMYLRTIDGVHRPKRPSRNCSGVDKPHGRTFPTVDGS